MFRVFAVKHSLKDTLWNCIYFLIPMRNLELDIHEVSAPVHLELFAKDDLDFKFIHLSGSFTKALPVAAIPFYAYSRLQNKIATQRVVLVFVREALCPFPGLVLSFMTECN
ncbi:hypothetical protein AVEN_114811-1 [Araneus ventricosus]|uniref:Uncharacterized protein n=1 Tax=Araneus ventricosus TaxID=182803 RepID=A0A4Y2WI92_ARAVE|nr:hypothetical protein AVEN_114811-1 [Araneus ventricosus]